MEIFYVESNFSYSGSKEVGNFAYRGNLVPPFKSGLKVNNETFRTDRFMDSDSEFHNVVMTCVFSSIKATKRFENQQFVFSQRNVCSMSRVVGHLNLIRFSLSFEHVDLTVR
jgi:hypothetical protein